MFSGGEESRSRTHTKEDGEGEDQRREGEEQRFCGRQAASGSQKASDGGEASGLRTTELRHGERREHRDLRSGGPDATLRHYEIKLLHFVHLQIRLPNYALPSGRSWKGTRGAQKSVR